MTDKAPEVPETAPEVPAEGEVLGGEAPTLSLTPQQQAEDILKRNNEFNVEFQALCKKFQFAITVVRQELPNGYVYNPQLMDLKFMPAQGVTPIANEVPAAPAEVAVAKPE